MIFLEYVSPRGRRRFQVKIEERAQSENLSFNPKFQQYTNVPTDPHHCKMTLDTQFLPPRKGCSVSPIISPPHRNKG